MRFIDIRRNIQLELHRLIRGPSFAIHGVSVEVPRSVGIELRYNLMRERYENDEAELIRKHVSRGCNVVELGGSLGIVSRVIRDTIGPGAIHIVVEANPDLVEICAQNAILEPRTGNTQVINAAVAYGQDEVSFRPGHNAHVGKVSAEFGGEGISVAAVTLGALVGMLPEEKPFCLVSDIEGAEWDLFEKEEEVFSRLDCAIVEIHPGEFEKRGEANNAFFSLIARKGLKVVEERANVLVIKGPAAP